MYINELRPNIYVVSHGSFTSALVVNPNNHHDEFRYNQNPHKQINSPIVIANPLPPMFESHSVDEQTSSQAVDNGILEAGNQPTTPPPTFMPQQSEGSTGQIDVNKMRMCLFHYIFLWPIDNKPGFWMYLTGIGKTTLSGYMWTGYRYVYKTLEVNTIESYQCY